MNGPRYNLRCRLRKPAEPCPRCGEAVRLAVEAESFEPFRCLHCWCRWSGGLSVRPIAEAE